MKEVIYTPYFIASMLDHYTDRLALVRCHQEKVFVKSQLRFYTHLHLQHKF